MDSGMGGRDYFRPVLLEGLETAVKRYRVGDVVLRSSGILGCVCKEGPCQGVEAL